MKSIIKYIFVSNVLLALFWLSVDCQDISDECLGCLCSASSGCNKNQGCTEAGVCGPFLITWGFWADAGKLTIKGSDPNNAYSDCTKDLFCSSETVRNYVKKYAKDCNGDGLIGCEDFARIHRNGPGNCGDANLLQTEFYKKFAQCQAQINPQ